MAKQKASENLPATMESNLPALTAPPSVLALSRERDEAAEAFGGALTTPRSDVTAIPLAMIDHKQECITIDGQPMPDFGGYPIHWYQTRSFWKERLRPGQEKPPVCWSLDMVTPSDASSERQCKTCALCEHSKFGSTESGGQACRTRTTIFVLNPAFGEMPIAALVLPPSSIRSVLGSKFAPGYFARAKQVKTGRGRAIGYHELVWMQCNVVRAGDVHCVLNATPGPVCPGAEEARAIAAIRERYMPAMESLRQETIAQVVQEEQES